MQKIPTSPAEKIEALRLNPYFSVLDEETLEELSRGTSLRCHEQGEIICWQGEPCAGLYTIRKGSVKLFKLSPKGRELIIKVFEEGASFNEVPVFDQGLNVMNVAALEPSEIWLVERGEICRVLQGHAEMAQVVILNLSKNLRMLVGMIEELSFHQVTNRLARLLCQLPPEQLAGQAPQRITQDQMAARLGTVREVVARSLRELERSGAIRVQRRQIQILNDELLRAWAQDC